jgi:hypothetical protein
MEGIGGERAFLGVVRSQQGNFGYCRDIFVTGRIPHPEECPSFIRLRLNHNNRLPPALLLIEQGVLRDLDPGGRSVCFAIDRG